jgi:hypothetical protein
MSGDVRYSDLIRKLGERGWDVVHRDREVEWWAQEIWTVESVWAPRGFTVYLTWLIDPLDRATVWCTGASLTHPSPFGKAWGAASMSINRWPRDVPEFLAALAELRDAALHRPT